MGELNSIYQYVSGVCGSGKTFSAVKKIALRVACGETIIYATETEKLLTQTKVALEKLGVDVCYVVSDKQPSWKRRNTSVVRKIQRAISECNGKPIVILCITKSLVRAVSGIDGSIRLPLYIDEGFSVSEAGEIHCTTIGEAKGIAAKLLALGDKPEDYDEGNKYKLPSEQRGLKQSIDNPLVKVEMNPSASKLQWIASLDLHEFSTRFSEITLLAACHEDTLQFYAIKASGCKQVELDWGLAEEHVTAGTVYVYWVLNHTEWRTYLVSKVTDDELDNIYLEFEAESWAEKILSVKGIGSGSVSVPVKSHGFNDFSGVHHFIDLHTQMPIPALNEFYKNEYGMSAQEIRKACYHYDRYQGAMRTSLRNSSLDSMGVEDHYYCFGDKPTAIYFASKLGSNVKVVGKWLGVDLACDTDKKSEYKSKVSETRAEQKNRSKDRKRLKEIDSDFGRLEEALIYLRDWRRGNPRRRMTADLYEQVARKFES